MGGCTSKEAAQEYPSSPQNHAPTDSESFPQPRPNQTTRLRSKSNNPSRTGNSVNEPQSKLRTSGAVDVDRTSAQSTTSRVRLTGDDSDVDDDEFDQYSNFDESEDEWDGNYEYEVGDGIVHSTNSVMDVSCFPTPALRYANNEKREQHPPADGPATPDMLCFGDDKSATIAGNGKLEDERAYLSVPLFDDLDPKALPLVSRFFYRATYRVGDIIQAPPLSFPSSKSAATSPTHSVLTPGTPQSKIFAHSTGSGGSGSGSGSGVAMTPTKAAAASALVPRSGSQQKTVFNFDIPANTTEEDSNGTTSFSQLPNNGSNTSNTSNTSGGSHGSHPSSNAGDHNSSPYASAPPSPLSTPRSTPHTSTSPVNNPTTALTSPSKPITQMSTLSGEALPVAPSDLSNILHVVVRGRVALYMHTTDITYHCDAFIPPHCAGCKVCKRTLLPQEFEDETKRIRDQKRLSMIIEGPEDYGINSRTTTDFKSRNSGINPDSRLSGNDDGGDGSGNNGKSRSDNRELSSKSITLEDDNETESDDYNRISPTSICVPPPPCHTFLCEYKIGEIFTTERCLELKSTDTTHTVAVALDHCVILSIPISQLSSHPKLSLALSIPEQSLSAPSFSLSLSSIPFFSGLSPQKLTLLARLFTFRKAEANRIIFREGQKSDGIYFLVDGICEATALTSAFKQVYLYTINSGHWFGESALVGLDIGVEEEYHQPQHNHPTLTSNPSYPPVIPVGTYGGYGAYEPIPTYNANDRLSFKLGPHFNKKSRPLPRACTVKSLSKCTFLFLHRRRLRRFFNIAPELLGAEDSSMMSSPVSGSVSPTGGQVVPSGTAVINSTDQPSTPVSPHPSQHNPNAPAVFKPQQQHTKMPPAAPGFSSLLSYRSGSILKTLPLFAPLRRKNIGSFVRYDEHLLTQLADLMEWVHLANNTTCHVVGDPSSITSSTMLFEPSFFLVVRGECHVIQYSTDSERSLFESTGVNQRERKRKYANEEHSHSADITRELKHGEYFGEHLLLESNIVPNQKLLTIVAKTDILLLRLPRGSFTRFSDLCPEIWTSLCHHNDEVESNKSREELQKCQLIIDLINENRVWSKFDALCTIWRAVKIPKGGILFREGTTHRREAPALYIISNGNIDITTDSFPAGYLQAMLDNSPPPGERGTLVEVLGPNDVFGSFSRGLVYATTAVAATDVTMLILKFDQLAKNQEIAPEFHSALGKQLGKRVEAIARTMPYFNNLIENRRWAKQDLVASFWQLTHIPANHALFGDDYDIDYLNTCLKDELMMSYLGQHQQAFQSMCARTMLTYHQQKKSRRHPSQQPTQSQLQIQQQQQQQAALIQYRQFTAAKALLKGDIKKKDDMNTGIWILLQGEIEVIRLEEQGKQLGFHESNYAHGQVKTSNDSTTSLLSSPSVVASPSDDGISVSPDQPATLTPTPSTRSLSSTRTTHTSIGTPIRKIIFQKVYNRPIMIGEDMFLSTLAASQRQPDGSSGSILLEPRQSGAFTRITSNYPVFRRQEHLQNQKRQNSSSQLDQELNATIAKLPDYDDIDLLLPDELPSPVIVNTPVKSKNNRSPSPSHKGRSTPLARPASANKKQLKPSGTKKKTLRLSQQQQQQQQQASNHSPDGGIPNDPSNENLHEPSVSNLSNHSSLSSILASYDADCPPMNPIPPHPAMTTPSRTPFIIRTTKPSVFLSISDPDSILRMINTAPELLSLFVDMLESKQHPGITRTPSGDIVANTGCTDCLAGLKCMCGILHPEYANPQELRELFNLTDPSLSSSGLGSNDATSSSERSSRMFNAGVLLSRFQSAGPVNDYSDLLNVIRTNNDDGNDRPSFRLSMNGQGPSGRGSRLSLFSLTSRHKNRMFGGATPTAAAGGGDDGDVASSQQLAPSVLVVDDSQRSLSTHLEVDEELHQSLIQNTNDLLNEEQPFVEEQPLLDAHTQTLQALSTTDEQAPDVVAEDVAEDAVVDNAVVDNAVVEDAVVDNAVVEDAVVEDVAVDEVTVEDAVVDEAVADDAAVEDVAADDLVTDDIKDAAVDSQDLSQLHDSETEEQPLIHSPSRESLSATPLSHSSSSHSLVPTD